MADYQLFLAIIQSLALPGNNGAVVATYFRPDTYLAEFIDSITDPGVNVGLKMYPNASAAWATIGREIKVAAAAAGK